MVEDEDDLECVAVQLSARQLRVALPYAGIFCAFSNREAVTLTLTLTPPLRM